MKQGTILVGMSAAGKSSFAGMVSATEINRDAIRFGKVMPEAYSWKDYKFTGENESAVTRIAMEYFNEAVKYGEDIIISDTNLNKKIRRKWIKDLQKAGYSVKIIVMHVSVEDAIERDSHRRNRVVGESVILRQFDQLQSALPLIEQEKTMYNIEVEHMYN